MNRIPISLRRSSRAPLKCIGSTEVRVPIIYRGKRLSDDLKLDLLVEDLVIVEIKSVDRFHPVHLAQVITYLKLANKPRGLLFNFNTTSLRQAGIRSAVHPGLHEKKQMSS